MKKTDGRSSKKQKATDYPKSGRWLTEPKPEHTIVLNAVEIANTAFERVVNVEEIIQALSPKEKQILEKKYADFNFSSRISNILALLRTRGKLFSTSRIGKYRYYGVVGILDPSKIDVTNFRSRRQQTYYMVREAVLKMGRALKMGELLEFAKSYSLLSESDGVSIRQDVLSLRQTGELLAKRVRGDSQGYTLYLPTDFKVEDYLPPKPASWLEFVLSLFHQIWEEHKFEVNPKNPLPLPITTGEIREKIRASGEFSEKLKDPKDLIAALQQLAQTRDPRIVKILRPGQKAILWIPIGVKVNEVNLGIAYAHDTERIEEAVKRACVRHGRPVNVREISEEIKADLSLEPVSKVPYATLISDMGRRSTDKSRRTTSGRVNAKFHHVGLLNERGYFYITDEPEAKAFTRYRSLSDKWKVLDPLSEISAIERCILPTVAFGRLKLLSQEIIVVSKELNALQKMDSILGIDDVERSSFEKEVSELFQRVQEPLLKLSEVFNYLPKTVDQRVKGLTVHEMTDLIKPYYKRASGLPSNVSLQAYLGESVRRIPNPDFKIVNSKDSRLAVKYLYDKTDALMYIAREYGGEESRLQAMLATNELGLLRDPKFVLPALDDEDFNVRLTAVSCMAFLQSNLGSERLSYMAENDQEYGIRQSALWAYGLATDANKSAMNFIAKRGLQDSDQRVRKFASNLIEVPQRGWLFS